MKRGANGRKTNPHGQATGNTARTSTRGPGLYFRFPNEIKHVRPGGAGVRLQMNRNANAYGLLQRVPAVNMQQPTMVRTNQMRPNFVTAGMLMHYAASQMHQQHNFMGSSLRIPQVAQRPRFIPRPRTPVNCFRLQRNAKQFQEPARALNNVSHSFRNFSHLAQTNALYTLQTRPPIQDVNLQLKRYTMNRKWTMLPKYGTTQGNGDFTFSVVSYNVLSDKLLRDNSYLYIDCDKEILSWEYRRENLLKELLGFNADILCLQEIDADHYLDWFQPKLSEAGYSGVYNQRTGDKPDGCAMFYRDSKFSLVKHKLVRYLIKDVPILNRDNVGIVILLKAKLPNDVETPEPKTTDSDPHLLAETGHGVKTAGDTVPPLLAVTPEPTMGSDPPKTGSDPPFLAGSGHIPKTGSDPPFLAGSDRRPKTGSDPPFLAGSDRRPKTGSDPPFLAGSDHRLKTGSDPPFLAGSDHRPKTGSDPPFLAESDHRPKTGSDPPFLAGSDHRPKTGSDPPFLAGSGHIRKTDSEPTMLGETSHSSKTDSNSPLLCVATTHLLFNQKRGDVKLAQLAYLFAEIDNIAILPSSDGSGPAHCPIVLCGDLNSLPYSPLHYFITTGKLNYTSKSSAVISGQLMPSQIKSGRSAEPMRTPLLPWNSGITLDCRWRNPGAVGDEIADNSNSDEEKWKHNRTRVLTAPFCFESAYKHFLAGGLPEVTTCHSKSSCNVDYIFFTPGTPQKGTAEGGKVCPRIRGSLILLGRLNLLHKRDIDLIEHLPNFQFSSDHIALQALFKLS